jgi:hypothetical protein
MLARVVGGGAEREPLHTPRRRPAQQPATCIIDGQAASR